MIRSEVKLLHHVSSVYYRYTDSIRKLLRFFIVFASCVHLMAHMDKQSKSQRKLRGKEKQSSLEQSFSRSQRKGKQRVPASATSVASGPSSTPSTKPVVIDLEDDPVGMGSC